MSLKTLGILHGLDYRCRECSHRLDRLRRQAKWAERSAKREHTEADVRGLASFLASLDPGGPHTATWWRQAARDGGFQWAGYGDVRAALSMAGIEPFDLRSRNLYAVADDYGRSGTRKTGKRKSTRRKCERHLRADESAPQGHNERKDGVQ
jgi:hypothetical protein